MDIDNEMLYTIFNYSTPTNEEKGYIILDYSQVQYNQIYKSFEFYDDKFPEGYENIPGFDKIIEKIVEKSKDNSPLEEYNKRRH